MSREEQENEKIEMEREEEKLKGVKRRIEIEKKKREANQRDIMETRVKVSYSMPLWLREKINKESLERGLYQWEYIAQMIEKASRWENFVVKVDELIKLIKECHYVLKRKIIEQEEGRLRSWDIEVLKAIERDVEGLILFLEEFFGKGEK
ncbi:MAG: hypothetical protein ACO2PO_23470 [Candidatus Calescibacterium sp.]